MPREEGALQHREGQHANQAERRVEPQAGFFVGFVGLSVDLGVMNRKGPRRVDL